MTLGFSTGYTSAVCAGDLAPIAVSFPVYEAADLTIELRDTVTGVFIQTAVLTTHYALSGIGGTAGCSVIPVDAAVFASGRTAHVIRETALRQDDRLRELAKFPGLVVEQEQDRQTAMMQDLSRQLSGALRAAAGGSFPPMNIADFYEKLVGIDANGAPVPRVVAGADFTIHAGWQTWLEIAPPEALDGGGLVDVRAYLDGNTDTEALAAAIADGDSVLISQDLVITSVPITKSVRLFSWNGSRIKQIAGTLADMFPISGTGKVVYMHDLVLDQDSPNQSATNPYSLIRAGDGTEVTNSVLFIERCRFDNPCSEAIAYYGDNVDTTSERVVIRDNEFRGGSQGSNSPVYKPVYILIADAPYATIKDNDFDLGVAPTLGRGVLWNLQTQSSVAHHAVLTIEGNYARRCGCMASGSPGCIDVYMWSKSSNIIGNTLQDVNGAGFNVKTQSRHAVMAFNSVDGISAGSTPMLLLPANIGDADAQFQIMGNQLRGASGVAGLHISGTDFAGAKSKGISVTGNQVWGIDDVGIAVDGCEDFSLTDNEVRGGTIAYSVQNCSGVNKMSGNRSSDAAGVYGVYIDAGATAEMQIDGHLANDNPTTAHIYAACKQLTVTDADLRGDADGILTGTMGGNVTINGASMQGLGAHVGVNIAGSVAGDLLVTGVSCEVNTPFSVTGSVGGNITNEANEWNAALTAPTWAAPQGTKVWNRNARLGETQGWLRAQGDWWSMAPVDAMSNGSGYLYGLTLSNNVSDGDNDIDIAAGRCMDSLNTTFMVTNGLTKRIDAAWGEGTGNGGIDTGSATNALYYVWLIKKVDGGAIDALISLSPTAPSMPSGWTAKRRLGAFWRLSGVNRRFTQRGDRFIQHVPIPGATSGGTLGTSRSLLDGRAPPNSTAIMRCYCSRAAGVVNLLIQPTFETDSAPDVGNAGATMRAEVAAQGPSMVVEIELDGSAEFAGRAEFASTTFYHSTRAWIDTRGRS